MGSLRYPALFVAGLLSAGMPVTAVAALEHDLQWRGKVYGVGARLPDDDLQRQFGSGSPAYDSSLDSRLMWRVEGKRLSLEIHHETTMNGGDSFGANPGLPSTQLDNGALGNTGVWLDLGSTIERGGRHSVRQSFDRLALQWQPSDDWRVVLGRQAVSWGSGRVFQPFDLFSPFAPTLVDRDYKTGTDLLLIERGLTSGGDLQLLGVLRGSQPGAALSQRRSSAALKWHGVGNVAEWELFGGQHYDEAVAGLSVQLPLGGAVLRSDVTVVDSQTAGTTLSGVVNIDYAFAVRDRPLYAFAEVFYNGFGVRRLPENLLELPIALTERIGRGELFTLMRNYLALGVSYEWHPLLNHNLTLIGNLGDGSALLQTQFSTTLSDRQQLDVGVLLGLGQRGDEYAELPLGPFPGDPSRQLTTGGGQRLYLRWIYHL